MSTTQNTEILHLMMVIKNKTIDLIMKTMVESSLITQLNGKDDESGDFNEKQQQQIPVPVHYRCRGREMKQQR